MSNEHTPPSCLSPTSKHAEHAIDSSILMNISVQAEDAKFVPIDMKRSKKRSFFLEGHDGKNDKDTLVAVVMLSKYWNIPLL